MTGLAYRIRRALPLVVVVALAAAGIVALALRAAGGEGPPRYTVELDNAFGLTDGADVRVAGVNVGSVAGMRVDPQTARALVTVEITRDDFGDLRADAGCSIEPQSLIGEYFLDCTAGTAERRLPEGGTIPVERTTGTIPPDLVANIMRRPQREQLGIILAELGAGFAARGPELQQVIRRAIPALNETDRVLEILGDKRRTIQALTQDADAVLARLAANRRDVGRFVREARDTATISAGRRAELSETIRRLPEFLRELRPTLRDLGTVAERQTPALRDLRASAGDLTTLLERLGPFADATLPALDALGEAAKTGTRAVGPARATIRKTRTLASTAEDPARNLRFVLEHIDDRDNAVERSPVSPGGEGFTGLEAFLRYPFVQSQAINLFDSRGYTLKLNALVNECAGYTTAETARSHPERTEKCNAWLGPDQPGITTPDPSASSDVAPSPSRRARRRSRDRERERDEPAREQPPAQAPAPEQQQPAQPPQAPASPSPVPAPPAPQLPQPPPDTPLDELLEGLRGVLPGGGRRPEQQQQQAPQPPTDQPQEPAGGLLDFLLGS